ncbi:unnamed protein product, partial [Amoebophrya sp. A120]
EYNNHRKGSKGSGACGGSKESAGGRRSSARLMLTDHDPGTCKGGNTASGTSRTSPAGGPCEDKNLVGTNNITMN